jgi:nitrile hydratase subunit beta
MMQAEAVPPRFKVGDAVWVRAAYPIGHVRTPHYIRNKAGIIERLCGIYANPEELAYGRSGQPAQALYRVRFLQRDVWPDYNGNSEDTVDVEIFQNWLEGR